MIFSVFRPSKRVGKKSIKRKCYYGQYRIEPKSKIIRLPLHTTDRTVAIARLQKLVIERQRIDEGLQPSIESARSAQESLDSITGRYITDMKARGNDTTYTYDVGRRIRTLLKECEWNRVVDITPASFEEWRAGRALSAKGSNDYLASIRGLLNWLCNQDLLDKNPLRSVKKVKPNGKPPPGVKLHPRRAFAFDELVRLVAVSEWRSPMYLVAYYTGLRRNELATLVWGDVHLDEADPHLAVRATQTKNRRGASIPLHPDVASTLQSIRPSQSEYDPQTRVFRPLKRLIRFKKDLKRAGIEYQDAQGRYVDFHSFRYSSNTALAQCGASERERMEFMRHSDVRLTSRIYTDVSKLRVAETVNLLPSILSRLPGREGATQNVVNNVCEHDGDQPRIS